MEYIDKLPPDNRDLSMFPGQYGWPFLGKTVELVKDTLAMCNKHYDKYQKQKIVSLKEIKMRPVTETHDYEFKVKNAKKFIEKGDKVKFTIRFKGRELQHSHLGKELMDKIKLDMQDIGKVELHPKFDGKQMIMVIQPL